MTWEYVFEQFGTDHRLQALGTAVVGILIALMCSLVARKVLVRIAEQTETEFDDRLIEELAGPIALSIAFVSFFLALDRIEQSDTLRYLERGVLLSAVVASWTLAAWRVITAGLDAMERNRETWSFVKPRTLPVFEITGKLVVIAGSVYFFFLSWDINLTAWIASAGILGIAVGFAAQDTLGNLVAGMFILAEAPFKLGDFLVLESGLRGRVVDIGLRTTRLMTLDDVEIIVPNQTLANTKVVNESGGPSEKTRINIDVGVAYGSDIDLVRAVLLDEADRCPHIDKLPEPKVMFKAFGDSSLDFALMVWAAPQWRPAVLDALNVAIYKRFKKEGVEIPFPQRDVWFKNQMPPGS